MQLDLDELWPDSASLVGLRFATPETFGQAQALLAERLDVYRWVWEDARTIAVRKTDAHLFADADLAYAEVEINDDGQQLTAQEEERYREWMHGTFAAFVERLRREG
ncbi:MAG TPA: hypothetical protein VII06_20035 [Chloroflexota bacterium]|jgi:hypothetical protein